MLGSTAFTRHPPGRPGLADLAAMLNMDMVGRLRGNQRLRARRRVGGGVEGARARRLRAGPASPAASSGDGFGPSDHSPFYAAGVPVLHFFTGAHDDYHKPSDDADKINAAGGARIAGLVADVARRGRRPAAAPHLQERAGAGAAGRHPLLRRLARHRARLRGRRPARACCSPACGPAAPPRRRGCAAATSWSSSAGKAVRDIHDLMYVLQRAKPGEKTTAVVERDGQRVTLEVTFGTSRR